jgi:D-beta-D-heptose 7-phosphate kinase / D-beta-D-heptose 1-phosphate adenosyltransferase
VTAPIVVVGDALLDRDVLGVVRRVCPDAPVPVVDAGETRSRPGGAALAAVLATGGPRPVVLVTALADDAAGDELRSLLGSAGVTVVDLGLRGPTVEKIRIRAGDQSLLRLDRGGDPAPFGPDRDAARAALDDAAAVVVADYGRGIADDESIRAAVAAAADRRPVVWDPHPRGTGPVPGAWLVTPSAAEAAEWVPADQARDLAGQARRATALRRRWRARAVAVTVGERGAVCVGPDGSPMVVPPSRVVAGDACGAGDAFAVGAGHAFADGAVLSEVVEQAVSGASAFVAAGAAGAIGAPEDAADAEDAGADRSAAPGGSAPGDAIALAEQVRAAGGTVVATGGCFDLLHPGHVSLLRTARSLGDCLVVLLNSDASVRRLKGPDRPLQREEDRAAVLSALSCVDAVSVFDEDTPVEALRRLRPHLFAKGGDYAGTAIPEAAELERWGGQAVVLPYLSGRSTTTIVQEAIRRARTS